MLLLEKLKDAGYSISLQGEELKLTWTGQGKPNPAQVKPLLAELKERKQEALAYIRSQQERPQQAQVIDFAAEAEKVKTALSRQGIVKIKSETLGEEVYWARDNKEAVKAPAGAVVYTIDELRHLYSAGTTREGLRQVHEAKKLFGGKVVGEDSIKNPFQMGTQGKQ